MRILARLSLSLIVVFISQYAGTAQTQPGQGSQGKGTVTGRVTVGGEPAAGVSLVLRKYRSDVPGDAGVVGRTVTDSAGNYRFDNAPAGHFVVASLATAFVPDQETHSYNPWPTVTISGSETAERVDLALARGGVITGKVTDSDGFPLTGQSVDVRRVSAQGQQMAFLPLDYNARLVDDRGIYRIYGLPAGHYRVSVGEAGPSRTVPGNIQIPVPQTWHPSTHDEKQARIVEVARGLETSGVDIKLPPSKKSFTVAGRVIDAATGMGLSNVSLGYGADGYRSFRPNERTDKDGRFRLEGFPAGGIDIFGVSETLSEYYSEPTMVEVREGNVEGVVVRMRRGVNVSGRVILEGVTDPAILARLSELKLLANVQSTAPPQPRFTPTLVESDGAFRIDGLSPGTATISIYPISAIQGFQLARVELNGKVQEKGIEIVPGRDIDGLRLIVSFGTGSIGGRIEVVGGELPEGIFLTVDARPLNNIRDYRGSLITRADARGRFMIEGLALGEYELIVRIGIIESPPRVRVQFPTPRPRVKVERGRLTEVNVKFEITVPEK